MDRRHFLRALGAGAASLPLLSSLNQIARAGIGSSPKRLITFFVSSGCARAFYWPDQPGTNFDLKISLSPLEPYRGRFNIIQGVGMPWGTDHRFGMDNCLTVGAKTSYELSIADGLGIDVLNLSVAPLWGGDEMSVRDGQKQPGISDPVQARDEILRGVGGAPQPNAGASYEAIRQFKAMALNLSQSELDKLSQKVQALPYESTKIQSHIQAVQELKAELEKAPTEIPSELDCGTLQTTALDAARGLVSSGEACKLNLPQLLDAQIENVTEAFKCTGHTMANIQVMHAWGNHAFEWIGMTEAHHQQLSHWIPSDPNGTTAQRFSTCHNWLSQKFVTLLDKLNVPDPLDPGKTILDNTVILWTSEVNGSDAHLCDSIPVVLVGDWGGTLKTNQFLQYEKRNIGDLFATLATGMGVPMTSYGDHANESHGLISEILA
jgi:hypothetical protein